MCAVTALVRDFRADNARFLNGLVAGARATTGRVYDAINHDRMLRELASWALATRSLSPFAKDKLIAGIRR